VKKTIALVAAVLVVVGGVIFLISRVADVSPLDSSSDTTGTGDTSTTTGHRRQEAEDWDGDANGAFGGVDLTQHVIDMVKGAQEWQAGQRPTDKFTAELAARHDDFTATRARLLGLRPFPLDSRVKPLYLDSAQLYIETANAYQAMVATPPGDVRTQLDLLARRLRELADRVFDRGHALVQPALGVKDNPDVDIRLPEEVPDWTAEGLAPGPPLDDKPPPASTDPQLHKATRPQQPRADWLAGVRALGLPSAADAAAAVGAADDAALRDQARALIAGAERLRTTPDPKADREEATRIRLSLLVDADACRAGQLHLADMARRLLVVGDQLWAGDGLPSRSSGLSPTLLDHA
jgi:hypothetical protein